MNKKIEIMAPAGDWISLKAAIDAGCNAVYFGIKGINMRAGAKNFTLSNLSRIAKTCHKSNIKVYLTLNTIIYQNEITKISRILKKVKDVGIDAVICWDFAVIKEATRLKVPVFASTQMSISNSDSLLYLHKQFGINRFVLARECSLDDIKKIKKDIVKQLGVTKSAKIEIEVFVHGAMCVSISGRCFLSQQWYGKSANRGECWQPCRREYTITDTEENHKFKLGNNYILSPKDLCTISFIDKLIKTGIESFKIEGRNRSPEYVYTVTKAYRKAVDYYYENYKNKTFKNDFFKLKKKLLNECDKVYNRGFSDGFFMGKPINEWASQHGTVAKKKKLYIGYIRKFYKKPSVAEIVVQSNEFKVGDEMMIQGNTTGVFSQTVESIEVEHGKVDFAKQKTLVGVKLIKRARVNDQVYIIK